MSSKTEVLKNLCLGRGQNFSTSPPESPQPPNPQLCSSSYYMACLRGCRKTPHAEATLQQHLHLPFAVRSLCGAATFTTWAQGA